MTNFELIELLIPEGVRDYSNLLDGEIISLLLLFQISYD